MAQIKKKQYSLFQRCVRVVQTSIRRANWWAMDHMPGLPNPPAKMQELRQPTFIDLWELSWADHKRIARETWREYWDSFSTPSDVDLAKSKQEIKDAARRLAHQVEQQTEQHADSLAEKLHGTQVMKNLRTISETTEQNVALLQSELHKVKEQVDPEAVLKNVQQTLEQHRSQDDVVTTVKKNVETLVDLAKTGRDTALQLEKKDVDELKGHAQSWFADKLMVGQSVLLSFISGYKEGKELEMQRENALLLTVAKQAAEEHKEVLKEKFDEFVAKQRENQRKDQEARASMEATVTKTAATAADSASKQVTTTVMEYEINAEEKQKKSE